MVLPAILIPAICAIFVLVLILILFNFGARLIPTSPCSRPRLNLRGKTVLLTGASSGIGREMARILHSKGAKLILASRSTDKLEKLCQELADQEPHSNQKFAPLFKPKYCRLDLEEIAKGKEELENFMTTNLRPLLSSSNQQIDVLINNAGQMAYGRAMDTEMTVLRRILDVNFVAHAALTQAIWPNIPDDGAIVVLGSIAGRVALPYMSAYSAAKHAIQAYFDCLRTEDPRPRLQILTVSAGYVNTDLGPNALNAKGTPIGCRDPGQVGGMSPEYAAKEIVAALEARQTELLLAPFLPRFLLSLRLFTPNLLWFFLHRNLRTIYGNFGMKSTAE